MFRLRPVREEDLASLFSLSERTLHGLTTLPADEKILARRIANSVSSFARLDESPEPGDEYVLVLEDQVTGEVVGTSAIVSKVGGYQPFYAYRLEKTIHESETLRVRKEVLALHLYTTHDGPTEIGTLFLAPEARRGGAGRLLSLGRFLLMAEHPRAFDSQVIAEMRGVIDDDGRSVFWEAIGRHFFDVDLSVADALSIADKRFIADLMPAHPIYLPILPQEVQDVVGRVHPATEPALHLLEDEGFRFAEMVDIFEAGPVVGCARDEIRTLRESRQARVEAIGESSGSDDADSNSDSPEMLIARAAPFAVVKGRLVMGDGGVRIPHEVAEALAVDVGDLVRYAPARASGERKPEAIQ